MSTLWLVATPIGNLGDLSPRAVEVLDAVDLVCCEDTRRTGVLLQNAGVLRMRLAVCNKHTEYSRVEDVLTTLDGGGDVALVSDAGTPSISDPGFRLVDAVIDAGHDVSSVPGPSAAVMALTVSGLPTDRFAVEGFLPRQGEDRSVRIHEITSDPRTSVIFESPRRILATLDDLTRVCGPDRRISVSRELTKMYEETIRGTLGTIDVGTPRGEYVIVLDGAPTERETPNDNDVRDALMPLIDDGVSTRDASAIVSANTGRRKREVYAIAVAIAAGRRSNNSTPERQGH